MRVWCAQLEAGGILYFPQTPVPISNADVEFLLGQQQTLSRLHKNIAYKPDREKLSGIDEKSTGPDNVQQMHEVMRRYSASVDSIPDGISRALPAALAAWIMRVSDRSKKKAATCPCGGATICCTQTPFQPGPHAVGASCASSTTFIRTAPATGLWVSHSRACVGEFAPAKLATSAPDGPVARAGKQFAQATGIAGLVPQWKRTPYDEFMMRLHNAMKEDAGFQAGCRARRCRFAPGSSWMVYTETVPHAVLGGQFALEQTFLVDPAAMVTPRIRAACDSRKDGGSKAGLNDTGNSLPSYSAKYKRPLR